MIGFRKDRAIKSASPVAIFKALNPGVNPLKLLAKIQEENDGYIGGTIRYGSSANGSGGSEFGSEYSDTGVTRNTDGYPAERFSFGDMTFDVDAAKELSDGVANDEIMVDPSWSYKINVDKIAAMNSKSTNPVLIAQIPTEKGLMPLLIDGHHRHYKATQEKVKRLPAFVLTPEQTLFILDTHPDLMTRLTQNLRDVTDKPVKKSKKVKKSDLTASQVHVNRPDWTIQLCKVALEKEYEHDPENLKRLRQSFDEFISEEATEKGLDPSQQVPNATIADIDKIIRREGSKYVLHSKDGKKRLGVFPSRAAAVKREQQIEYFKTQKKVTKDQTPRVLEGGGLDGLDAGSNAMDGIYSMAQIVSGMDWELGDGGLSDMDDAKLRALENLSNDPDYYRKKRLEAANLPEQTAKDTSQTDRDPLEGLGVNSDNDGSGFTGVNLDLGSGQCRESGYLGIDLYPFDHGTIVHDLEMGIPFPDESCENVRMSNVPEVDPKILMSEIQRVLQPGGQFIYEGPGEIYNYPPYLFEDSKEQIDKSEDQPGWTKQRFRRLAMPDAATSNDAEPRIGVAQYDMLPADALLAMDATGYYNSDATSSGRGNRIHGYPSQGALLNKHYCPIFKTEKWKQIVYCVVLSPDEADLQGDIMTPDEIEKAAHNYLLNARVVGAGHSRPIDAGVVESYICPQDYETTGQLGPQKVVKGAWVIGIKVRDPAEWQKVVDGEYTGVSVGGYGSRTPV